MQTGKAKLYPPAGSPFPHATGWVETTWVPDSRPPGGWLFLTGLSVSKLAPNTQYYAPVELYDWDLHQSLGWTWVEFTTDANGRFDASWGWWVFPILGAPPFEVYDAATGTLVLSSNPDA